MNCLSEQNMTKKYWKKKATRLPLNRRERRMSTMSMRNTSKIKVVLKEIDEMTPEVRKVNIIYAKIYII